MCEENVRNKFLQRSIGTCVYKKYALCLWYHPGVTNGSSFLTGRSSTTNPSCCGYVTVVVMVMVRLVQGKPLLILNERVKNPCTREWRCLLTSGQDTSRQNDIISTKISALSTMPTTHALRWYNGNVTTLHHSLTAGAHGYGGVALVSFHCCWSVFCCLISGVISVLLWSFLLPHLCCLGTFWAQLLGPVEIHPSNLWYVLTVDKYGYICETCPYMRKCLNLSLSPILCTCPYAGVSANFYPWVHVWLVNNWDKQPDKAKKVMAVQCIVILLGTDFSKSDLSILTHSKDGICWTWTSSTGIISTHWWSLLHICVPVIALLGR